MLTTLRERLWAAARAPWLISALVGAAVTAVIMVPAYHLHREWRHVAMPIDTFIVPLRDLTVAEAAALAEAGELCRLRVPSRMEGLLTPTFPVPRPCDGVGDPAAKCWEFYPVGPAGTRALYDVAEGPLSASAANSLAAAPWCDAPGNPILASKWGRLLPITESLKLWLAVTWAVSIFRSGGPRLWRLVRVAGVVIVYYVVIAPDALVLSGVDPFHYRFVENHMRLVIPLLLLPLLALWAAAEAVWLVIPWLLRACRRGPVRPE